MVGGVLWYAAISKAVKPAITIESLSWAFDGAVWPILFALVAIEIILGACLIFRVWPRWSVPAGIVLFLAFSGWLAYLHATNAPVPCGCGDDPGAAAPSADTRWFAIGRNALLLSLLVLGLIAEIKWPIAEHDVEHGAQPGA